MSYTKRTLPARLVRVTDVYGDTLLTAEPAPFYRCEDRPRRIPTNHPMATYRPSPALLALPGLINSGVVQTLLTLLTGLLVGVGFGMLLGSGGL